MIFTSLPHYLPIHGQDPVLFYSMIFSILLLEKTLQDSISNYLWKPTQLNRHPWHVETHLPLPLPLPLPLTSTVGKCKTPLWFWCLFLNLHRVEPGVTQIISRDFLLCLRVRGGLKQSTQSKVRLLLPNTSKFSFCNQVRASLVVSITSGVVSWQHFLC